MHSHVGETDRGPNWCARDGDRRPGQFGKINVRLRNASAGHTDTDRVSAGLARVGLPGRMILIVCVTVMVPVSCCQVIVIVRGWTVVVIRVIMPEVFVDVQGRRHGRRHDQGLNKKECDEPAHGRSVLRPAEMLRKSSCVSRLGSGLVAIKPESAQSDENPRRRRPDCPGKGDHERQGRYSRVVHAQRPVAACALQGPHSS